MSIGGRKLRFGRTLPLFVLIAGAAGCVDRVDTAVLSCPCAAGYICCESGVCAAEQTGCAQATAALSATVAGRWTGYVENLAGGDDAVSITISVGEGGALSGNVAIGSAMPPAPATDGTVGWPASNDHGLDTLPPDYISGFSYTAKDMSWHAKRLRIRMPTYEAWEPWCALQQSHLDPDAGVYRCSPPGRLAYNAMGDAPLMDANGDCLIDQDFTMTTDPLIPFGCAQYAMCDGVLACNCGPGGANCTCGGVGVCECDATGCHAASTWMSAAVGHWFDLAFDDPTADGSVTLGAGQTELHNVRLMRAPEVH